MLEDNICIWYKGFLQQKESSKKIYDIPTNLYNVIDDIVSNNKNFLEEYNSIDALVIHKEIENLGCKNALKCYKSIESYYQQGCNNCLGVEKNKICYTDLNDL